MDLVVVNGEVMTPAGLVRASIGVDSGRTVSLSEKPTPADEVIDASGLIVLPGLIDAHTHFRDPASPDREDFDSGTAAAAAGGYTTVLEMPVADVGISTAELLVNRAESVQQRARVDFGLIAGASHRNLEEIPRLADAGAVGFKTYLIRPSPGRERNFSDLWVENDGQLLAAWRVVATTGLVAAAHCENQALIDLETSRLRSLGRHDLAAMIDSRPPVAEIEAVSRAILIAREAGASLHIVHLTTAAAARIVARAKAEGQRVSAEVSPPHLYFDRSAVERLGPYALHTPPLRTPYDVAAMWDGLVSGTLDFVATDHAPYADAADKEVGWDDPWQVPCGESLLESTIPLLLTALSEGRLSLELLVRICAVRPAQVYGLYPKKGAVQIGSDADFTIIDPSQEWELNSANYLSRGGHLATMFDGWRCVGRPVMTVVRGRLVMKDGTVVGSPGWGQIVRPSRQGHA